MAVKGIFKDLSFVELLQIMHLSRKTGRIEVSKDNLWAMVIFKEGIVWHVEPRGFKGAPPEEVLYKLIGMTEGNFVMQRLEVLPTLERSINIPTETLIMEGMKRSDDVAVISHELGIQTEDLEHAPANQVLKIRPGAEAKVRYVPQNVKKVVQCIDGQRDMSEVIQMCQLDHSQAAQIVKDLLAQGILEMAAAPKEEKAQPV